MSQSEKSVYYRALRDAGVVLDKPYNKLTTAELAEQALALVKQQQGSAPEVPGPDLPGPNEDVLTEHTPLPEPPAEPMQMPTAEQMRQERERAATAAAPPTPPRSNVNEDVYAGVRQNTKRPDEVIRVDDRGREWLQEEVRKPAFAKSRARRVTRYMDTGTETKQVGSNGQFESFEVAGKLERPAEIKTTLPSFQTGIYRHPSYPFKVHTYNGREGFDLFEVRNYFGGADLVPDEIKHVYISQDLCYDIRTTKRAIDELYRRMVLNKEGMNR